MLNKNLKTMKKVMFSALALSIVMILSMNSCQKEKLVNNNEKNVNIEKVGPGGSITVSGKPHRSTEDRPRDGKNCGCNECFGLCDLSVDIEVSYSVIIINPINTTISRIYFTEDLPNFEEEFGIDEDLIIPKEALSSGKYKSYILKQGVYSFVEEKGTINNGVKDIHTYGFVDVSHKITY